MNKKALSPVLTMVIVVLGVVVGVVLLWVFANKAIERGGEATDPDCLTTDLDVLSCVASGVCNYNAGASYYRADILVRRGVGSGDLTGLRFSFEDSFGRKGVYDFDLTTLFPGISLEELQSLLFHDPFPASIPVVSFTPYLVRVIALVGQEKSVCPSASTPQICSVVQVVPPPGSKPQAGNGQCCQWPPNLDECYDGCDPDYIINPLSGELNGNLPPGNISICCEYQPGYPPSSSLCDTGPRP